MEQSLCLVTKGHLEQALVETLQFVWTWGYMHMQKCFFERVAFPSEERANLACFFSSPKSAPHQAFVEYGLPCRSYSELETWGPCMIFEGAHRLDEQGNGYRYAGSEQI